MSFQAMTWAVDQRLPAAQKLVLLMLANRTNHDTGRCDPSHKRLADECGMSIATVKRAISELETKGLLRVIHRSNEGVNLPNQYQLNLGAVVGSSCGGSGHSEPTVGSPCTEGGVTENGGVGSPCTTNQEDKPGIEPGNKPIGAASGKQAGDGQAKGSKKSTSMPDGFQPGEQHHALAAELGVNLQTEFQQFADYHAAKGSSFKCWDAALRTWIRNAAKFSRKASGTGGYFTTPSDQVDYRQGVGADGRF